MGLSPNLQWVRLSFFWPTVPFLLFLWLKHRTDVKSQTLKSTTVLLCLMLARRKAAAGSRQTRIETHLGASMGLISHHLMITASQRCSTGKLLIQIMKHPEEITTTTG